MIPPDFSLNAPHSTEEEMGRLSSSWKVVEGLGPKVGKPVGGREVVGIGAPRAKRGVHTRTGGARTGESITARGERCWWAAWGRAPLALIGWHDTRGFSSSQCSSISFIDRSCALISGQELLFLDHEY